MNIAYIEGGKPFFKVGITSWLRRTFQRNFYQFQWLTVHERSLMNEREVAYFWNNFPELIFFKWNFYNTIDVGDESHQHNDSITNISNQSLSESIFSSIKSVYSLSIQRLNSSLAAASGWFIKSVLASKLILLNQ